MKKKPIGSGDMTIMGEHKYWGSGKLLGPHINSYFTKGDTGAESSKVAE